MRTRGDIEKAGGRVFLGELFRGESLELKKAKGGDLEVFFGAIRIGTINPQTVTFTAAVQNRRDHFPRMELFGHNSNVTYTAQFPSGP